MSEVEESWEPEERRSRKTAKEEREDKSQKASKIPQFAAGYAGAMGGFNTGITLGWASGGLMFIREMRGHESLIDSWISSVLNLGACVSLVVTAVLMDRLGRKWTMVAALPLFLAVWLILAFVENDISHLIMRLMMGITTGCFGVVSPVYAGEIAEKKYRGTMGVSYQLMSSIGILYTYCMSLLPNFMWFNLVNIIPLVIFAVWIVFMPESPYFLLKKNQEEKARKSLQWLRGKHYDIEAEFAEMKEHVESSKATKKLKLWDLSKEKAVKRALWIGCLLMICQQLSGINAVIFNMEGIFQAAASGEESLDGKIQAIIIGVVQVVMTLVAAVTIERAGRRLLMMVSMAVMGVFQFCLFIFFIVKDVDGDETARTINWLPILSLACYIAGFSLGAGPIPWSMMGEIFAEKAKAISGAVVAIFSWLLAFLVTWLFFFLVQYIPNWIFFLVFAVICFLGLVAVFFFVVETKDRTFPQIQAVLEGNDNAHAPICFRTQEPRE